MGSSRVAKIKGKSKNSILYSQITICHHQHEAEAARAAAVERVGEGQEVDHAVDSEAAAAEAGLEAAAVVDQEVVVGEVAVAAQTEAEMQGVESGQGVDSIANSTVSE